VGYLSPNFRHHSVAFFIEPVLEHHDRSHFHVFAYSDVYSGDAVTQRIAGKVETWRDVSRLGTDQIAAQILEDKIDVLVDLAGHTSFRQMLLMSMRVAPVQATYLGYPNTTGLDTVDFRLTDDVADPQGKADSFASEKLVRLPRGFLCYRPPASDGMPEPTVAPALSKGFVTFGSFNNLNKVSPRTMDLWASILREVPRSRLYLKARQLADPTAQAGMAEGFQQRGVEADRVSTFPWAGSQNEHLRLYNEIDIALDTFPYNGTTTTCEALWMGVPVITLYGNTHRSRVGLSLLRRCGLDELAAATADEYVQRSAALASDGQRVQRFHSELRSILSSSSLVDAAGFCTHLESAYRGMIESVAEAPGTGSP
jgi:protein O-GlcNAc transferase